MAEVDRGHETLERWAVGSRAECSPGRRQGDMKGGGKESRQDGGRTVDRRKIRRGLRGELADEGEGLRT